MSLVAVDKKLDHLLACSFLRSNPQDGSSAQQPFPRHREFRYHIHDSIAQYYYLHYAAQDIHVFGYDCYLGSDGGDHLYQEAFEGSDIPENIQKIFHDLMQICTADTTCVAADADGYVTLQTPSLMYNGGYTQKPYKRFATVAPPQPATPFYSWPAELEKPDQEFYDTLDTSLHEDEKERLFREYHRRHGRDTHKQIDEYHEKFTSEREGIINTSEDPYKKICMAIIEDGINWRIQNAPIKFSPDASMLNPLDQFNARIIALKFEKWNMIHLPMVCGYLKQPSVVRYMNGAHIHAIHYEQMHLGCQQYETLKLYVLWHTNREQAGEISQVWTNYSITCANNHDVTYTPASVSSLMTHVEKLPLRLDSIWIQGDSIVLQIHFVKFPTAPPPNVGGHRVNAAKLPLPLTTRYALKFNRASSPA
jgi:hypothetical protein